ncbi:unnamed protein product [Durusdinium trenchii]|uniref:Ubiquitin-like domain-containing protein n=1 Tax=Durusdinium trenchii TaxID=1381693 RepID=A0ABP0JF68_9DINO
MLFAALWRLFPSQLPGSVYSGSMGSRPSRHHAAPAVAVRPSAAPGWRVCIRFVDGGEMQLEVSPKRPLEELLLMISQKLDNFPVKYLKLPLESASSSSILTWKDGEQSLEALGLHDGLELLCVKSSPMASAVPAAPSDASALKAVVFESEERKELETVSMYLELQAEGWKELSWCGPVQIMLQASVAEVILDAQQLLMNLAREAPDSTMPMNSFPKLSMRLNSLLLMQYSIYRWHPCERIQLGFSCGPTLNEKFSTPLSELRFPSGSSLQDGDCLCLFSQMD